MHKPGSYKPSQEALDRYAADVSAAARRGKLLDAARAADIALRQGQERRAPVTELHRLATELDAALTAAMLASYAAQRAEIGPRGYEDRIFARKARAKPGRPDADQGGRAAADAAREPPDEPHPRGAARAGRLA